MINLKWRLPKIPWKFGVRYQHGKILFFKANDNGNFSNPETVAPSWAVDIREVIAMIFVGTGAVALIFKGYIHEAMYLLVGLFMYATGRTVPGGKQLVYETKKEKSRS
ncbi:unnamed protein product [marine sediment metagenome]|uniref:Uncharacterized protein n=1 Tax=marine sediment metagenome TaxID=412755 RepID=X1VIY8_9ZZZZ